MFVKKSISVSPKQACYNPDDQVTFTGLVTWKFASDGREHDPSGGDNDDQPPLDISDEIEWRSPAEFQGKTWEYVIKDTDLQHPVFAIYARSQEVMSIRLKIVKLCEILKDRDPDALRLAMMMFLEGSLDGGGDDERRAQGYVAVNRWRADTDTWGHTLQAVIEHKGAFAGIHPKSGVGLLPLYKRIRDPDKLHCIEDGSRACQEITDALEHTIGLAEEILADPDGASGGDPIRNSGASPAFYFNKAPNSPPDGPKSPRVWPKGKDGWTHSFYGSTRFTLP